MQFAKRWLFIYYVGIRLLIGEAQIMIRDCIRLFFAEGKPKLLKLKFLHAN